jgi:hypothetical protein
MKAFVTTGKNLQLLLLFLIFYSGKLFAQSDTMAMPMQMPMDTMQMKMTSAFSPNLPMNRDGSGTSWQPDQSPMMMYMKMIHASHGMTSLMVHGSIFLRYTSQDITNQGSKGGDKFDAPNWIMLMLVHQHPKDLFSFHLMMSADALTEGGNGYPLLFQSGESYHGVPLVDRQHPHDLVSELALNYTHSFNPDVDLNFYAGYPGEPALGPVVFMHRLSALNDPDATLSHHWQDATHITFGVGTIGLRYKMVKAEGSIFTGREPDENRYNFDKARFDSYSYRLSVNPNRYFALQFSQGFIHSPEALEPEINVIRTTASIIHTKLLKHGKFIATTLAWGMNHNSTENLHSLLLESNLKLTPITIYARYEFVQKDANELQQLQFNGNPSFNIHALTLGVNKTLLSRFKTDLSLGVQGTIDFPDERLQSVYGTDPLSAEVYLKLAPAGGHHH